MEQKSIRILTFKLPFCDLIFLNRSIKNSHKLLGSAIDYILEILSKTHETIMSNLILIELFCMSRSL